MAAPGPTDRRARISRIRRTVAGGATVLFLATLGAVVAWGRQPVAPARAAATRTQQVVPPAPADPGYYDGGSYDDGGSYQDGGGYYDGGAGPGTAPPTAQPAPAPTTTRQS